MQAHLNELAITHYYRKEPGSYSSFERIFTEIRRGLPARFRCRIAVSPFVSRGFWKRLANILAAPFSQGDVNHIVGDNEYIALLLRKRRTIITIHDCVVLERLTGLKQAIFFFLWYWLPEKRVCAITVVSQSTKEVLLRYLHCDPDKIRVIHNCVSSDFQPSPRTFDPLRPVLLQVGTRYNKNLLRVVEALQGIPCHLRIIGELDKEQVAALLRFGIDYSWIAAPSDKDILQEYRQADILIFVSTYEGFGLPIVEANVVGRPVVTSNILSMPEVAGKAACLVNPYDVQDIRKGIVRVLSDKEYREELVSNGYDNALRFKPDAIAAEYVRLYEEVHRAV